MADPTQVTNETFPCYRIVPDPSAFLQYGNVCFDKICGAVM